MSNETESFFYKDEFYHAIEELAIAFEDHMEDLPDELICCKASLEPVVTLSADWIIERIDDDRFDEEGNATDKVYDVLKTMDFTAVNAKMPKMYYQTRTKFVIKKSEILEIINEG